MFCLSSICDNANMHRLITVTFLLLFFVSAWGRHLSRDHNLKGAAKICSNEGEEVEMELVNQNPCFHCICRGGQVECDYGECPSLRGCHAILFTRTPGSCCDQCKGCSVNGTHIAHGEMRIGAKDPCEVMMCEAGVLTKSRDLCKPSCSNPVYIPGQCCPSCSGCFFEGKAYRDGELFSSTHDEDLECSCFGGNITCSKRVCPVLNCPPEYLYSVPGQRCPQCKGQRRVYTLRESCYFARQVYDNGDVTVLDSCTSCMCQKGTMYCERQQCPDVRCPPSERIITQGECCPKCRQRPSCIAGGKVYQHGKKWKERQCTDCMCDNGKKWCRPVRCSGIDKCPLGYKIIRKDGECCEKCVKEEKTCSVSGPHFGSFKTLDGSHFNVPEPTCKYTLLKDCYQQEIDIKIRYKPKQRESHSSISHISITIGPNTVKMSRNFKIRVNRTRLTTRRYSKSGTLHVRVDFPRVIVQDKSKGLRVIWNMNSELKVKVDRRYRKSGRLCGLCGNFNGHKGDDFINHKGQMVKTPKQMLTAWSLRKSCISNKRIISMDSDTPGARNTSVSDENNVTKSDVDNLSRI